MRIPSAYIATPTRNLHPPSLPASLPPAAQRHVQAATDSYNKNARQASAQFIDAEYVEFYTPNTEVLRKERHNLDFTLAADPQSEVNQQTQKPFPQAIQSYQQSAAMVVEPAGSRLNIYA